MRFHFIAGLPRAGSTLVANVLAQHPDVHVGSTSVLARAVEVTQDVISTAPEVQSDLINVPGSPARYGAMIRGMIEGLYADREESIVIDKARGWMLHRLLLDQIMPQSVIICCVRDPRNVVASIERVHRNTGTFSSPLARTLLQSIELLMHPIEGMLGYPMRMIEDAIRRNLTGVHFVKYEALVRDPLTVLDAMFEAIELPEFTPNTENVEDHATDADGIYFGKYPHHDAVGQIKATGNTWRDVMDEDLAELIGTNYPLYMETFGYTETIQPNREQRRQRR